MGYGLDGKPKWNQKNDGQGGSSGDKESQQKYSDDLKRKGRANEDGNEN